MPREDQMKGKMDYAIEVLLILREGLLAKLNTNIELTLEEAKMYRDLEMDLDHLLEDGPPRELNPPLTRMEAAQYLKISLRTLYNRVSSGRLFQLPGGLFLQTDLDKLKYRKR